MEYVDQKIFLKAISNLPSPPAVLRRIAEITADPCASASQLEQALRLDSSISGKVLRLANSAYIGMPHAISSLHHAIVLLGNRRIHSLILGSELLGMVKRQRQISFSLENYWRHSVLTAMIAESIARHLKRYDTIDEHAIFSGAVLHDIGKLIVELGVVGFTKEIYQKSCELKVPFYKAEEEGMSHTTVGDFIAVQWKFPQDLRNFIAHHHAPLINADRSRSLAIIHVADVMTHVLGYSVFQEEIIPSVCTEALSLIELPVERLKVIAKTCLEDQKRFEALIDVFK